MLGNLDIVQGVAAVLRTTCPECKMAAEAGEGCNLSLVPCANSACPVSNWCVRCHKAKKLTKTGAQGERLGKRCVCSNVLEGEACFNWRWECQWEPQLRGAVEGIAPASRGHALELLQELIQAGAEATTAPENNEQWEQRFKNRAYLMQHDHLRTLQPDQAGRRSK